MYTIAAFESGTNLKPSCVTSGKSPSCARASEMGTVENNSASDITGNALNNRPRICGYVQTVIALLLLSVDEIVMDSGAAARRG